LAVIFFFIKKSELFISTVAVIEYYCFNLLTASLDRRVSKGMRIYYSHSRMAGFVNKSITYGTELVDYYFTNELRRLLETHFV